MSSLLKFLGYSSPDSIVLTTTAHQRQADEVTEEWLRQYLERGRDAPRSLHNAHRFAR